MRRIYELIFIFYALMIFGCKVYDKSSGKFGAYSLRNAGLLAPLQLPPHRDRYPSADVVYTKLVQNLSALKASYSDNRDAFLPVKSQFEDIFGEFDVNFGSDEARDDVYSSLKYDTLSIANLQLLIKTLISSDNKDIVLKLLYRLRASGMYIREIVDENYGVLNKHNVKIMRCSNNVAVMSLINASLDEMLKFRDIIVGLVKNILGKAISVIDNSDLDKNKVNKNQELLLRLNLITDPQGDVTEKINGLKSLRSLRVKIEDEFDDLRLKMNLMICD
ncbi:hypothetical protein [Borrelia persica]|uniref:hypothetical protein n=1 Tax=Borrelia persica TaxID=44448 RepID=UPI000463BE38|nr:hypothetical protein [Borrelia persica]